MGPAFSNIREGKVTRTEVFRNGSEIPKPYWQDLGPTIEKLGKYVLGERCDFQFAGESRAKYVSESAVSVAVMTPARKAPRSGLEATWFHMAP